MSIRLVAIDLDGTLLDSRKKIAPHTAAALAEAAARGVHVVITTARPPRSVRAIYRQLQLAGVTINYNGALIWDEPAQAAIYHRPIDLGLPRQLIDAARELDLDTVISCEILDKWYTDRVDDRYLTETARLFKPDVIAPLDEFCHLPVTKLMLHGEPYRLGHLARNLHKRFHEVISIMQTDPDLLQLVHRRTSKRRALKRVAKHYAVNMQDTLAIGDALNDVGMVHAAGVGVAMDNAHPRVKAVADWIAPSNDDHGVHAALVRYGIAPE